MDTKVKEELDMILRNGCSERLSCVAEMVKAARGQKRPVFFRGTVAASRVCYDMGITDINPDEFGLDYRSFLGFEGEKEVSPEINVGSRESMTLMLDVLADRVGNDRMFVFWSGKGEKNYDRDYMHPKKFVTNGLAGLNKSLMSTGKSRASQKKFLEYARVLVLPEHYDEKAAEMLENRLMYADEDEWFDKAYIYIKKEEPSAFMMMLVENETARMLEKVWRFTDIDPSGVDIRDEKVLQLLNGAEGIGIDDTALWDGYDGLQGIPSLEKNSVHQINRKLHAGTVEDVTAMFLLSMEADCWTGYAEAEIEKGKGVRDVICCREDLWERLAGYGIEQEKAYEIMEFVRKGKAFRYIDGEKWHDYRQLMIEHGVTEEIISLCENVSYLMPKAHGVTYMVESLRLAWYKVHEPEAFYMAWAEENAGKLHRYRDDILEAVKDVKTMECWLLKNCDFDRKFGEKLPVMRVLQEMLLRGIDVGEIIDPMLVSVKECNGTNGNRTNGKRTNGKRTNGNITDGNRTAET